MRILFIGGYFDKEIQLYVEQKSKGYVEYTANNFQRRIIEGIIGMGHSVEVLTAPFVGAWPKKSKIFYFKRESNDSKVRCVSFINIWGIRNVSRKFALEREIKKYKDIDLIIIYSVHTPFIISALKLKKNINIPVVLVVPDLPEYMNLSSRKNFVYKILKSFDIKKFYKLNEMIDSYVFLTEPMNDRINKLNKPFIIVEGIIEYKIMYSEKNEEGSIKKITYAGKLETAFGVKTLIHAVHNSNISNILLQLCGDGELVKEIKQISSIDPRIKYLGFLKYDDTLEVMKDSDILINPRVGVEEFTKYSFPSKNIEYISSGRPLICSILPGMKKEYKEFIYEIKGNSEREILDAILEVLNSSKEQINNKCRLGIQYINDELIKMNVASRIIKLSMKGNLDK